jgi:hypothetical protein
MADAQRTASASTFLVALVDRLNCHSDVALKLLVMDDYECRATSIAFLGQVGGTQRFCVPGSQCLSRGPAHHLRAVILLIHAHPESPGRLQPLVVADF